MKNMKKVFAFVLALAMILTTYQPTTTYAATKAPTIYSGSVVKTKI